MCENLTKNARKPLCFMAEMPSAKYCTIITLGLICLVKVKCPSAEVYYTLRVPPEMKTCKEAVAWTFHMGKKEYNPQEEA